MANKRGMAKGKRLCLNMIVRNEMANLERCLGAVADHVACWVIGDTGSTDGTQKFIKSFFTERGVPGELYEFPFHNFEQARNQALSRAYASRFAFDYLLLADADMELVVEDRGFRSKLTAPGYRLIQRTESGLTYWNTRLVQRKSGARYRGVTHEYLDVPGGVKEVHGVWYKDHATGSNRVDKFERDIRLLSEALESDPGNQRYWFYLAQSYRDAGRTREAVEAYAKRAAMGGWGEEAWEAHLQQARCLRTLGDEGGFLREAILTFNQRPQRAEPLYDLARFYRERGQNEASLLFCEQGLALPRPEGEILFLEDFVYAAGMREEFSIAANYSRDPAVKARGHAACNWLALNREIPQGSRNLARSNLYFYFGPATAAMPSFTARPIGFAPPDGYRPSNPSVARWGEQVVLIQRAVNYSLEEDGQYHTPDGEPIRTRNFLLRLSGKLEIESATEILPPANMPKPVYDLVLGFEDMRLFAWHDELWSCANVRELTPEGWCQQVLARLDLSTPGVCQLTDWRVLGQEQGVARHEKNWMPQVIDDRLQFIYLCDPTRLVDEQARTVAESIPVIAAEEFRGGSQVIGFDGGWLALIHEARERLPGGPRYYQHRFVWFDETNRLRSVSRAFYFHRKGVEFAAGLAWHPDEQHLLVSYSVADREAWVATIQAEEVQVLLENAEHLSWGAAGERSKRRIGPPSGDGMMAGLSVNLGGDGAASARHKSKLASSADIGGISQGDDSESDGARQAAEGSSHEEAGASSLGATASTEEKFLTLAPFLRAVDSPEERRQMSRAFDAGIGEYLDGGESATLPQVHCFYEVMSDKAEHRSLIAATASMRAAGHPVSVWSYTPAKLEFLQKHGIELKTAEDVVPRGLFERILARTEIRYLSDLFRYAVLYEQGGLWMDSDVIMLRPFPYHGDHFLNLQWRGGHKGHFICGNVLYAERGSRHMRNLYETSMDRFFASSGKEFGDIGPKLLSDYVMSDAGAELQDRLFSPMFFNPIDWTEVDRFDRPISELAAYLNDDRVFGVHLWNARTHSSSRGQAASLIAQLSDPLVNFPSLTTLADKFDTDKNRHTGNRHCYARVYDRLLSSRRFSLRRLMEVGLCRGLAERNQTKTPSVELWQAYFPFGHVIGVDLTDFSALDNDRFTSFVCDQSNREQLRSLAAQIEPASLDVIIDDGSHASVDQQQTFREFFPLLAAGGWYFIEDLDWQPPGEDPSKIALTKTLLREIQQHGKAHSIDPVGVSELSEQIAEILFFDSHYELQRAKLLGGLVAIRKRGGLGLVG